MQGIPVSSSLRDFGMLEAGSVEPLGIFVAVPGMQGSQEGEDGDRINSLMKTSSLDSPLSRTALPTAASLAYHSAVSICLIWTK